VACASSGVKVDPSKVNDFTVGKSTCADVQAELGNPTQRYQLADEKIRWVYSYAAVQAHPETFIPIVGAFVGGADTETTMVGFRFSKNCILEKTISAESGTGTGTNLEGIGQDRKDTREVE
jgi:hypothetical protein